MATYNPRLLFHIFAVVWYILLDLQGLVIVFKILTDRHDILFGQFGIGIQYFSLWNVTIQHVYFVYCLKEDLMPKTEPSKENLRKVLDLCFNLIVLPVGFFVANTFWSLYYIDVLLLDQYDALATLLQDTNHSWHTFIVPLVVMETFVTNKSRKGITNSNIFSSVVGIQLFYYSIVGFLYIISGVWPYPFFQRFSYPLLLTGVVIQSTLATVLYDLCYRAKDTFYKYVPSHFESQFRVKQ